MSRLVLLAGALAALSVGSTVLSKPHAPTTLESSDTRLLAFDHRLPVTCPEQTARTAVILAAGQSNIANHGQSRIKSAYPGRTFAAFQGRCFALESPLLGASGTGGEFLTPMADLLIADGTFDTIVVAPASVGGTTIAAWADGALRPVLMATARSLAARYRVTHVLWQQGESDTRTPEDSYVTAYRRIDEGLRAQGLNAPVYVAVSTYCLPLDPDWAPDNPAARALRHLPGELAGTRAGADIDQLTGDDLRIEHCHLSAAGQRAVARAWATILSRTGATP